MNFDITRRRAVIAGAAVSVGGLAIGGIASRQLADEKSEEHTTETFNETYDAAEIDIATDVGSVSVIGADRETVELEVEQSGSVRSLDRTTLTVDGSTNTLDVTVDYEQTITERLGLTPDSRPDSEIVLTVPHELERAVLETVNGAIDARDIEATVTASTTNGTIDVDSSNIAGLNSTNGDIDAVVEALAAETVIETTNGDVALETDELDGDVTFESTNGEIDCTLGDAVDTTVTVSTTNGEIEFESDRASVATRTDEELEAVIGEGTNDLHFETTNGDITIVD
ncbi:hypothetical protein CHINAEXTREME_20755 (plasmid) [Halobiforma lacisalsi AJ5]|uniref:DUF4097 domain-containing protein n=1 Tax=Natronobacterium lacisalsi AJ5 TaxID=358396 RepID=M0L925_NATLA|nr:DUF4097 family beta strand repeat-containing protein [Halobiforma lacisalsi]APX00239.1 hypothetical protein CHINAEXTREME_20755 [Halobiforma lacisalsi AJ5]EMA30056.1 hypothetical protein C445_16744 [Halobiforma lacisalsi AJ5]